VRRATLIISPSPNTKSTIITIITIITARYASITHDCSIRVGVGGMSGSSRARQTERKITGDIATTAAIARTPAGLSNTR
jgi:hypothetical protein